jgi:hypothetical protein
MLRFFRQIRQSLLKENKVTRYFLYVAGEIVLVVIGILLALQINTWNEEKQIAKSIETHLGILRQNLLEDQNQLRELRQIMGYNVQFADSALLQMSTQVPVGGNLKKYLGLLQLEQQFKPNRNAYETITQSNEIPYLTQELQTAILNYYALIASTNEREHISNTQIQSKYEPYVDENYPEIFQKDSGWEFIKTFYKDDPRKTKKIAPEKFLADRTLEALVVSRYYQSLTLEQFYADLLKSSDAILGLLE